MAATDRNDARASFSNANADVEIAAAGVDDLGAPGRDPQFGFARVNLVKAVS